MITSIATISLFILVAFLIYVIYCFSFYDDNKANEYLLKFNTDSYDFVYDHMYNNDNISKEKYNYSVNLMFKKNMLEELYDLYYSSITKEEFMNDYYYGNNVNLSDIKYITKGKTNLFKRKKIEYYSIDIKSKSGNKSSFGIKTDISLVVEPNSKLIVDEEECKIENNECFFPYILGGLHSVKYVVGDSSYFALLNIVDDDYVVDVNKIDKMVRINKVEDVIEDIDINLDE